VAGFQSLLILLSVGISGLVASSLFKKNAINHAQQALRNELNTLSLELPSSFSSKGCQQFLDNNSTFKILSKTGENVCDTNSDFEDASRKPPENLLTEGLQALAKNESRFVSHFDEDLLWGGISLPTREILIVGYTSRSAVSSLMRNFNQSLGLVLIAVSVFFVVLSLWFAKKLVFPLGRLLIKTQNLISRHPRILTEADLQEESFGEWTDLESNIDDLGKSLERTAQNLTTEQVELDAIMGAISDAILAVDKDEIPIFYNSRFEMIFGGGKVRRNLKLWEILRDPEILKAYKKALTEGKSGGTRAFSLELENQPKQFFSLSVSPLRKHGGSVYGALGIFHDITELKVAEQMRIDFVANVSHELRTPLTAIKGYTETLLIDEEKMVGLEPRPEKEYLQIISRNSERLMNLMGDLLELSALESSLLLQKESLSTREITERVLRQLEARFKNKNQKTELNLETLSVMADPNRLEQVLINLLDNASKYTPEGGVIRVSWEPDRKGGKDIFLKVKDSGPGIAPKHLGRLFERFYRVDKARSREQGGTGLGLAIVKHIMQRHEGAVWVESTLGEGSLFTCRFPG